MAKDIDLRPTKDKADNELSTKQRKIREQEQEAASRLKGMKFTVEIEVPPQEGGRMCNFHQIAACCTAQFNKVMSEKVNDYLSQE